MAADKEIAAIIDYLLDRDNSDYQPDEIYLNHKAVFSWTYQNIWGHVIDEKFRLWNQTNYLIRKSIAVEWDEASATSSEYSSEEENEENTSKTVETCKPGQQVNFYLKKHRISMMNIFH